MVPVLLRYAEQVLVAQKNVLIKFNKKEATLVSEKTVSSGIVEGGW